MEWEAKVRKYASVRQMLHLVDYMFDHREVVANRFNGPQGRLQLDAVWSDVAEQLNAIGGGTFKSVEKWKQTWRDLKANVKKKANRIRLERMRAGDSIPKNVEVLNDMEHKVLAVMGFDTFVDMEEIAEVNILENGEEEKKSTVVEQPAAEVLPTRLTSDNPQLELTAASVTSNKPQPGVKRKAVISSSILAHQSPEIQMLSGTTWSQRRLALRPKRKRTLAILEERALKYEEERLELEKAKFQFEKQYKTEKLKILKRIAAAVEPKCP